MADPSMPAPITPMGVGVNSDGRSAAKAVDVELDLDDIWMRAKAGEVSITIISSL